MSASSNTMTGALPPSSRWTRLRSAAAAPATCMPARTDPVIETMSGIAWSTIARPVSRSPQITLNTPGGRNSAAISASSGRARRRRVARLEHDGVARRDGRGELPDRHHQRVVPRGDLGADADRLAPDERRVAGHVLPRAAALEVPRRGGEEAELVDGRRDLLRPGQGDRLAGVLDLEGDQLLAARLDGVGDAEQRQRALRRRRVPPALERRPRRRASRRRRRRATTAAPCRTTVPVAGSTTSVVCPPSASTRAPLTKFENAFMPLIMAPRPGSGVPPPGSAGASASAHLRSPP